MSTTIKKARLAGRAHKTKSTDGEIVRNGAAKVNRPFEPSTYSMIVRDKRITASAFRLWHLLRDFAGARNESWPSLRRLSRLLGSSPTRIRSEWLPSLVRCGYLSIKPPNKSRASNTYFLRGGDTRTGIRGDTQRGNGGDTQTGIGTELIGTELIGTEPNRVAVATSESATPFDRGRRKEKPDSYRIRMKTEFAEIEQKLLRVENRYTEHALESFAKTLDNRKWLHSNGEPIRDLRQYFLGYVESQFPDLYDALTATDF